MTINLYQSSAENNRIDKVPYLTLISTLTGTLKEETSIINPSILIEQATLPTFNYVYIPDFNRYYFVKNVESYRKNLWRIDCHVDVLTTYRSGIFDADALISRSEYGYDNNLVDDRVFARKNQIISVYDFAGSPFSSISLPEYPYVISVVRSTGST